MLKTMISKSARLKKIEMQSHAAYATWCGISMSYGESVCVASSIIRKKNFIAGIAADFWYIN